jgi:hypothetical protein
MFSQVEKLSSYQTAEGVRLELTTELPATCFQDKLLIQPDTLYVAESEGIEPSSQIDENCLSRTV